MNENPEPNISICRTCLSEKHNTKNIFDVSDILMKCFPIIIEAGDGLPATICPECENKLNIVNEFRQLCLKSDEILHSNINSININDLNTDIKKEELDESSENSDYKEDYADPPHREVNDDTSTSDEDETKHERTEKQMQCKYCDLKFRYKVRLKNHELKHLDGLKCHICSKSFPTIKQLTNHINIHSRKGAHLCQVCGKQFTLPENLVRHQRIHNGIRPYKCNLCNKSFTQSNELKSHIVTHTAEKNHLCSICGNKYSRSISLRVHIRRMHSIPANHRPYVCSVCGRNFKDRRDLSQHMQIHTGERSHICKVCNKAFNRSSNLRVHERIHTGQKPHQCPVCHRAFIQKHVLITHMRTHPHNNTQVDQKNKEEATKLENINII